MYYYAQTLDNTMLVAIEDLAAAQTQGNNEIMDALMHLLNYMAIYLNAKIRYYKSGMILYIHSNRSYLFVAKRRSRVGNYYFFLSKK